MLTITGKFFGTLKENAVVKVSGVHCKVVSLTREEIKCVTGPYQETNHTEFYPGKPRSFPKRPYFRVRDSLAILTLIFLLLLSNIEVQK